jgi:hypothetical protein
MSRESLQKKKKKGHSPAHQNETSWVHNPKSKKTAAILAAPIAHVCRRCHDKLEWRKQYRKYKPRTQPGRCNDCQKVNVLAAYHTICEACTRTSPKSLALLQELNLKKSNSTSKKNDVNVVAEEASRLTPADDGEVKGTTTQEGDMEDVTRPDEAYQEATKLAVYRRVCAMCTKEPALAGEVHDDEEEEVGQRYLRLRERKTLERQKERATDSKRGSKAQKQDEDNDDDDDKSGSDDESESEKLGSMEDPFLKAVGGADKLLTGEAYQEMLLQKQKLQIS